jgi:hypothetical protein
LPFFATEVNSSATNGVNTNGSSVAVMAEELKCEHRAGSHCTAAAAPTPHCCLCLLCGSHLVVSDTPPRAATLMLAYSSCCCHLSTPRPSTHDGVAMPTRPPTHPLTRSPAHHPMRLLNHFLKTRSPPHAPSQPLPQDALTTPCAFSTTSSRRECVQHFILGIRSVRADNAPLLCSAQLLDGDGTHVGDTVGDRCQVLPDP